MDKSKKDEAKVKTIIGVVTEALPNMLFRVKFEVGEERLAYLAGRMRHNHIRVLVGDRVEVEPDQYGGKKDRIVKRL